MKKIVCVIPARYASTRLMGKPLLQETGKFLIQHVYDRVAQCNIFSEIVVATDDKRILRACQSFGAKAVMTSRTHKSGTDRIAEAAADIDCDVVVNVQGDEPLITCSALKILTDMFKGKRVRMATLANRSKSALELANPNIVKVVIGRADLAEKFTREPVTPDKNGVFFRHLGIYGYTKEFLLEFAKMPPSPGEIAERLEQLRAIENGVPIKVGITRYKTLGIDTREDYDKFIAFAANKSPLSGKTDLSD